MLIHIFRKCSQFYYWLYSDKLSEEYEDENCFEVLHFSLLADFFVRIMASPINPDSCSLSSFNRFFPFIA